MNLRDLDQRYKFEYYKNLYGIRLVITQEKCIRWEAWCFEDKVSTGIIISIYFTIFLVLLLDYLFISYNNPVCSMVSCEKNLGPKIFKILLKCRQFVNAVSRMQVQVIFYYNLYEYHLSKEAYVGKTIGPTLYLPVKTLIPRHWSSCLKRLATG